MEKQRAEMRANAPAGAAGNRVVMGAGGDGAPGGGTMIVMSRTTESGPPLRGGGDRAAATGAASFQMPAPTFVAPSELPDYKPAFAAGATRADADGNVWVRTIPTKPMAGPVYDVIDGRGALVDRVMLPAGSTIAGFGPGGVVYYGTRDAAGVHLHRSRVVR
jgi:hypothetical protein